MGDYTNAQLTVYSTIPEEVRAFTRCIDEYGLKDEWAGQPPPSDQIILGHMYCDNDVNIGFVNDYSIDAPNSAWVRWNDPKYEWLGDLEIHVPALGYFTASCDAEGNVQLTPERIIRAIQDLPEDAHRDQVLQAIGKLSGQPWRDAINELKTWEYPAEGPVIKAAPLCANCGEQLKQDDGGRWVHLDTLVPACKLAPRKRMVAVPDEES